MLNWLRKSPLDRLKKEHAQKLIEARDLQRKGDIVGYAAKMAEAEEVIKKIDEMEAAAS